jgi:soluble epoxide hydrolase/lipid-phosphate phosphatase
VALVGRNVYPVEQYPAGQWEYLLFYQEHFAGVTAVMKANIYNIVKLFFRKGNPAE